MNQVGSSQNIIKYFASIIKYYAITSTQRTKNRRLRPGALSAAERSYPTSEVRGGSQDELPCEGGQWQREETPRVRGLGQQSRGATQRLRPGEAAERSYAASEVRGGWENPPRSRGQEQRPRGATLHWRPGVASKARGCRREGGATRGAVAAWA